MKHIITSTLALALLLPGVSLAAPAITNVSGTLTHGSSITVSGSGFGTKAQAVPVVWDDAGGASIVSKWTGGYPSASSDSNANIQYRPVGYRGVAGPHPNDTHYIVGAHCCGTSANNGIDVMLFKSRTMSSFPQYTYASWYERVDPAWTTIGLDANNYKIWDFSYGTSPYIGDWHLNFTGLQGNADVQFDGTNCQVNDNGTTLTTPAYPNWWGQGAEPWTSCMNPLWPVWRKYEVEIKYSTGTDGYIHWITDGDRSLYHFDNTRTVTGAGTWSEAIGGYSGWYQTTGGADLKNYRYYSDVYLDYTLQRAVLANASNLADATIVETQIPSAWSDTTLTLTTNLGQFATGAAYLYVTDANGAMNATGYPITVGGPPDTTPPVAPTGLGV